MARIKITIECDECLDEISKIVRLDARNQTFDLTKEMIQEAQDKGWHIGFLALCPECKGKTQNTCGKCIHYEHKCSCTPYCTRLKCVVSQKGDYCSDFISRSN